VPAGVRLSTPGACWAAHRPGRLGEFACRAVHTNSTLQADLVSSARGRPVLGGVACKEAAVGERDERRYISGEHARGLPAARQVFLRQNRVGI
jgi:hypothetical protein